MKTQVIVRIKDGKLLGVKQTTKFSGTEFFAFYGIPYAEPPIYNLRFKNPVKVKPWKGTREATTEKGGCIQFTYHHYKFEGSEDCLYVNVYTPSLPSKTAPNESLKAVVVNIHPGGLFWGSPDPSSFGSPEFVMQNDIVYVTVGYRLHILGFLKLDIEDCPGNQAMKDVIMAFQWVKDNIQHFNGDPNNITAMGASSSSILLHLLMLHHPEKDLFHKVVIQGLIAFNPLIYVPKEPVQMAFEFGRMVGFDGDNPKKLLAFLKTIPPEILVTNVRNFYIKHNTDIVKIFCTAGFMPEDEEGQNARKAVKSMRKIPVMYGVCEKEAALAYISQHREQTEKRYKTAIRQNKDGWGYNLDDETLDSIFEQVEDFYSKGDPDLHNSITTKIDILSDAGLAELYTTFLDAISAELPSSVFVYKFQYKSEVSGIRNIRDIRTLLPTSVEGSFHCDDYCNWSQILPPKSDSAKRFIRTFTKLISTFAKTGNPNSQDIDVKWEPTNSEHPCYLSMNDPLKLIEGKLNGERMEFWENIVRQYKNDDID